MITRLVRVALLLVPCATSLIGACAGRAPDAGAGPIEFVAPAARLCTSAASVAFDRAATVVNVEIWSCGAADLVLDEMPAVDGDPSFNLQGAPVAHTSLAPDEFVTLRIRFNPPDADLHLATLIIASNDVSNSPLEIPISGQGLECPIAVIDIVDPPAIFVPFQSVTLSAGNSVAVRGAALDEFVWRIVEAPAGSLAGVGGLAAARLELDGFAGLYVVALDVIDDGGVRSCTPALVEIPVAPDGSFAVELRWDHPDADLDLHALRDGGEVFDHGGDVFFSNREPAPVPPWSTDPDENPILFVDDSEGYGPEVTRIASPAEGSRWRFLVHYWNRQTDNDPRASATLRAFDDGALVAEQSHEFVDDQQLWTAFEFVDGDDASILVIDSDEPFARPF